MLCPLPTPKLDEQRDLETKARDDRYEPVPVGASLIGEVPRSGRQPHDGDVEHREADGADQPPATCGPAHGTRPVVSDSRLTLLLELAGFAAPCPPCISRIISSIISGQAS